MKIVYIHPVSTSSGRANIVQTLNMIYELSKSCKIKAIYSGGSRKTLEDYNIPVDGLDVSFCFTDSLIQSRNSIVRLFGLLIFSIKSLITSQGYQYVYTRDPIIAVLSILFKRKVIFEEHAFSLSIVSRYLRNFLYSSSNVFPIYISEALLNLYTEAGFGPNKHFVYHDCARIFPNFKSTHNVNILNVGFFGSISEGRGYEIVKKLAYRFENIAFHMYGRISLKDSSAKVPANLFVHKPIAHRFVREKMLTFDLLLVPYEEMAIDGNLTSYLWMSPIKLFESMESGVPFICSDLEVLREVINDNHCFLAKPGNIDSWISALERSQLISSREEKALASRLIIDDTYNWKDRVKSILKRLEECGF